MSRYRRHRLLLRHSLVLLAIPLAISGTGYALFTQNLSIATTTRKPAYSYSLGLLTTYTKTETPSAGKWVYNISPMTIKNNGTVPVSSWQVVFDLPGDATAVSCTSATCTQNGSVLTVASTGANGIISVGGTETISLTFTSATAKYTLQNVVVTGVQQTYTTMAGLTMTAPMGARTKTGKWYNWPITITVTNTSGRAVSSWRIVAPWSTTTNRVTSMPTTVNYVAAATTLTITSKTPVANGGTFQFIPTLGSTSTAWTFTGYTIQGLN